MKKQLLFFIFLLLFLTNNAIYSQNDNFVTVFEKSNGSKTATYHQLIAYYKELATYFPAISVFEMGLTDSGFPLHLLVYNNGGKITLSEIKNTKKNMLLINNGIHPGESDGIDASMLLLRDLAVGKIKSPNNTLIAVIPVYNIGGALKRNSTTRTNQNGPLEYGFRGNARNYDLNRDFIKCNTKNAQAFSKLFHLLNPQVFVDTHVSNGADYQYTLTHLFTQHNKLGGEAGNYLHTVL